MRASTNRKPTSSRKPACPARSRSRPTCAARAGKPAKLFAVLNARFHEQEAYIVAEAGVPGAITIATNMAGRGTDIKLGGSLEMRIMHETADITDEADQAGQGGEPRQDRHKAGRALHHRLRTPRIPPHRQPAARPIRTPGRSRTFE